MHTWPGYGQVAGCYESGNEPSASIKYGNFSSSWVSVTFAGRTVLHGVSLVSHYLLRCRPKCRSQPPILENPRAVFFIQRDTHTKQTAKIIVLYSDPLVFTIHSTCLSHAVQYSHLTVAVTFVRTKCSVFTGVAIAVAISRFSRPVVTRQTSKCCKTYETKSSL